MRHGERGRPEILRRMRGEACACLPRVRCGEHPGREVLRRLRGEARRAGAGGGAGPGRRRSGGSSRCSSPIWSASRRSPRAGPGGDARAPLALLRDGAPRHRAATAAPSRSSSATRSWRSGARRSRRRTTPSEPSEPRSTSSARSPTSERRRGRRAAGPRRRRHRRGGGHDRRRRAGHGCGRHGQHRVARPAVAEPGNGARRRSDRAR